jgi:surface protein
MTGMFFNCSSLKELDLSKWDVSKVISLRGMFAMVNEETGYPDDDSSSLVLLKLPKTKTSACTDMGFMFWGLNKLETLDVSNLDTTNVTSFYYMFASCDKLVVNGYENWNTSKVQYMNTVFHSVDNSILDLSNWDTSSCKTFAQMFGDMDKLVDIKGIEDFDTSNGEDFHEMFSGCNKLTTLDLSSFDTTKANDSFYDEIKEQTIAQLGDSCMKNMFNNMSSLEEITLSSTFSFDGNGTTAEENVAVLPTPSGGYWYGSDGTAYAPENIPDETAGTYYSTQQ